jgi:F-box protein 21
MTRLICRDIGLILLRDMKNRREIPREGKSLLNALFIIQCFHPNGIFLSLNRLHLIGKNLLNDPIFSSVNLTEKCQLILSTMKKENFLPANDGNKYYDLENSFLYPTFNGKPTIPLTLVAIFCALAEECGLIARPIGFPGEVMAQVNKSSNDSLPLIISVFDSKIISLDEINERLADVLDEPLTNSLPVTPITELVIRSARNMINSITRHSASSSLNSYGLYAAVSVLKILGGGVLPFAFDSMMNILKEHFPMDISFFEMLSSPMTTTNDDLRRIRNQDSNPLPIEIKQRNNSLPKFYVGQIFQHKQYNYWGVICGWDLSCMASTLWQNRMGISDLTRGATQPFYHILANDSSRRYVAEDNINILAFTSIENEEEKYAIVKDLCATDGIGRQFERVDIINAKFIPNIELYNEYPTDFV